MRRKLGRGSRALVGVFLVGVTAGVAFLGYSRIRPDDISSPSMHSAIVAADRLVTMSADIEITIEVKDPARDTGVHSLMGQGVADFSAQRAQLEYDFSELPNSAGIFGQLFETDVIYESVTTYVEIFPEKPRWVSFTPSEVVGQDLERLREVALTSPLIVPDLMRSTEFVDDATEGAPSGSFDPSVAAPTDPAAVQIFDALGDDLGVDEIALSADLSDGNLTRIVYSFSFPVAEGSRQEVKVEVTIDLAPAEGTNIVVPGSEQVRAFSTYVE